MVQSRNFANSANRVAISVVASLLALAPPVVRPAQALSIGASIGVGGLAGGGTGPGRHDDGDGSLGTGSSRTGGARATGGGTVSASLGHGAGGGANGGTTASGGPATTAVPASTARRGLPVQTLVPARLAAIRAEAHRLIGKLIMSSDNHALGMVEDARATAAGRIRVTVHLSPRLGLAARKVDLVVARAQTRDHQFWIGMSRAEFLEAI